MLRRLEFDVTTCMVFEVYPAIRPFAQLSLNDACKFKRFVGWTFDDAIDNEIPALDVTNPDRVERNIML